MHPPELRDLHDGNEERRLLGVCRGREWYMCENLVPNVGLPDEVVGDVHAEGEKGRARERGRSRQKLALGEDQKTRSDVVEGKGV
jgi:hypothetical protein